MFSGDRRNGIEYFFLPFLLMLQILLQRFQLFFLRLPGDFRCFSKKSGFFFRRRHVCCFSDSTLDRNATNLVLFRLFSRLTLRFHGLQSFLTSDFLGLFFRLQCFQTFPLCLFTDFRSTLFCFQGFLVLRLDLQLTFSRLFFPALFFLHIFLKSFDNGLFCRTDLLFVRSRRHAAPCSRSTRHL